MAKTTPSASDEAKTSAVMPHNGKAAEVYTKLTAEDPLRWRELKTSGKGYVIGGVHPPTSKT